MGGLSRVCWEVENEYDSYQTDKKELAWDQAVHTGSDGGRAGKPDIRTHIYNDLSVKLMLVLLGKKCFFAFLHRNCFFSNHAEEEK